VRELKANFIRVRRARTALKCSFEFPLGHAATAAAKSHCAPNNMCIFAQAGNFLIPPGRLARSLVQTFK